MSETLSEEELYTQLFESCEKGDIANLKLLIEPPLTVDVVVCTFFKIFNFFLTKFLLS